MRKAFKFVLLCLGLLPMMATAQLVDREKYPDYTSVINPDPSLMKSRVIQENYKSRGLSVPQRPDHVNNAELKFFPPMFNQDGGSCGSASRICFMFTYELNAYRNADGKIPSNYYPSHFVWLLTYGNSGKEDFVKYVGVPSAEVYGGQTYSSVYGNADWEDYDYGWMQGYDKWYSGMWNRMIDCVNFPVSVQSEEGREAVKNWLWNHNGDTDFYGGGICGIGVAAGGDWQRIPKTKANDAAGVTNMYFVNHWGTQVNHALTVVGYDDRIEFDLDGNGVAGEAEKDEVGAWIIANSWGLWCNDGFIYCPYAYAGPYFKEPKPGNFVFGGDWWQPEVYKVRKDYRPLRTIKLKMDYSRRSEMYLSLGISSDIHATEPERTQAMDHFKWAGDGRNGDSIPAPEVPMLGRWADGKLHYEPMEFGYDVTDLTAGFDRNMPLKYFFTVETRPWAEGTGHIYDASIIDYEFNHKGVETPFDLGTGPVEIQNKGAKTVISVVVYGESFYAPQNLTIQGGKLAWAAPMHSRHAVEGYNIYADGELLTKVAKDQLTYQIPEEALADRYSVKALYEGGVESEKITVNAPVAFEEKNRCVDFQNSGFTIPNVFATKYNKATIEFWMKPTTVSNYNQSAGPGWGTFMWHANADGAFTVGWDTNNRTSSAAGTLSDKKKWKHIAIVVDENVMSLFIDGNKNGVVNSDKYKGIGGFGNLQFGKESDLNARIEDMRIWNYARTESQIRDNMKNEFSGDILPYGLVAYYKGDTLSCGNQVYYRDCVGGNHAPFANNRFKRVMSILKLNSPSGNLDVNIVEPKGETFVGVPVVMDAVYADGISRLTWNVPEAGITGLSVQRPSLTFNKPGSYQVIVEGINADSSVVVKDTCAINVLDVAAPDASFTTTLDKVPAGVSVSFIANKPVLGYQYEWEMKGAEEEKAFTINAAAVYPVVGEYTVTLTVSDPNGKKSSTSQVVSVVEVAPVADFDIAPAVVLKDEVTFLRDRSKYTPTSWTWMLHGDNDDIVINGQQTSFVPTKPGVYDVTLKVANGVGKDEMSRERGLIICNADSKNALNFTRTNEQVILTKTPFKKNAQEFTIEWWMKPTNLLTYSLAIGEKDETFLLKTGANGAMRFSMRSHATESPADYVIANQWHHYALAVHRGTVSYYRDGILIATESSGAYVMPELEQFAIGHPNMPMSGQIDEFRVWNSKLTEEEIRTFANAPIADIAAAENDHKLMLYYSFNQNGGNVKDLTSNQNDGIRHNFGPDGDAWGLSRGVFCLNFDAQSAKKDITANYLKNYKAHFAYDNAKVIHPTQGHRYKAITDWTIENTPVSDKDIVGGVNVCLFKDETMTVVCGWDDFPVVSNQKVYQTITLPEGSYTFTAVYGKEGTGKNCIAVAEGKGLPNTADLEKEALGFTEMLPKNKVDANSVHFVLSKETEVSVGLVINMGGLDCTTFDHFELKRGELVTIEADGANGYDLQVDESRHASLYLPYPTVIPEGVTAYWAKEIKGNEIALEPIADGIIPAKTGVVIEADAGKHHFDPSTKNTETSSLLSGTLVDMAKSENSRYYTLDNSDVLGFYPFAGETLPANRAFLERDKTDTNESYMVKKVAVHIDDLLEESPMDGTFYDLTGRKVLHPIKGLYITNGKKIYIK